MQIAERFSCSMKLCGLSHGNLLLLNLSKDAETNRSGSFLIRLMMFFTTTGHFRI